MGGKVWSEEEERVFWTEIIPSSNKRHLFDRPHNNEAAGWESLRQVMQRRMGRLARRRYTALMLYEHFFQNSVLERLSPNAAPFVRNYIANERATTGYLPSQRSRSSLRFVQRGRGSGRRPNSSRRSQAATPMLPVPQVAAGPAANIETNNQAHTGNAMDLTTGDSSNGASNGINHIGSSNGYDERQDNKGQALLLMPSLPLCPPIVPTLPTSGALLPLPSLFPRDRPRYFAPYPLQSFSLLEPDVQDAVFAKANHQYEGGTAGAAFPETNPVKPDLTDGLFVPQWP